MDGMVFVNEDRNPMQKRWMSLVVFHTPLWVNLYPGQPFHTYKDSIDNISSVTDFNFINLLYVNSLVKTAPTKFFFTLRSTEIRH